MQSIANSVHDVLHTGNDKSCIVGTATLPAVAMVIMATMNFMVVMVMVMVVMDRKNRKNTTDRTDKTDMKGRQTSNL